MERKRKGWRHTPSYVKQLICVFSTGFITDTISLEELTKERTPAVFRAPSHLWDYLMAIGMPDLKTKKRFDAEIDKNYIHKLKSIFHLILAEYFNASSLAEGAGADLALSKILLYISGHYTEKLSLAKVGEAIGYSPKYVSNCFSAMPEFSFRGLINSLRIEKAKSLLADTDKNNIEIAMECGFSTNVIFQRVFTELTGTTPGKFRNKSKHAVF